MGVMANSQTSCSIAGWWLAHNLPLESRVDKNACEKFVQQHGGKLGDIAIYGQESNPTTWKLCKMNLAIRGIEVEMLDDEEFEEKMTRLTAKLSEQLNKSKELEQKIRTNLGKIGFEIDNHAE